MPQVFQRLPSKLWKIQRLVHTSAICDWHYKCHWSKFNISSLIPRRFILYIDLPFTVYHIFCLSWFKKKKKSPKVMQAIWRIKYLISNKAPVFLWIIFLPYSTSFVSELNDPSLYYASTCRTKVKDQQIISIPRADTG